MRRLNVSGGTIVLKLLAAACVAICASALPAAAANFSFDGNFVNDNDRARFDFTVGAESLVTLLTYSYAGGVNAEGKTIARGGFDPILSIYDSAGKLIKYNDDGVAGQVPSDSVTGRLFDTYFEATLAAGSYTVFVTQYDNFGPTQLPGSFRRDNQPNFANHFVDSTGSQRDSHWAFDVLNVENAVTTAVPEPATWAMLILGFGFVGSVIRRGGARPNWRLA
jgi:hypothetical protein